MTIAGFVVLLAFVVYLAVSVFGDGD